MCNLCPKYNTCVKLCDEMLKKIRYGKREFKKNRDYSREVVLTDKDLENILYTNSLSYVEYERLSNLVVAILSPKQKQLLKLFSEGKSQRELAKIFNVSQSSISQSLQAIKKEISNQFKMVINS
ncbi:LuxR C-terminal-related transcriptional regulator [Brachyspira pilosicoli]|uniref:ArsR family transcriptional regulator n=1 Tax=Brachyspira pilosicoli TaxID=52584 RepID=A0A5C8FBE0_BRAPL|nr:LuxR C-terminal-related transcriptional regulator [Brachyspira pilosicoli]TXJ47038.1 ArsR family transcriptional regulator [Brachyspira pilosicoli]